MNISKFTGYAKEIGKCAINSAQKNTSSAIDKATQEMNKDAFKGASALGEQNKCGIIKNLKNILTTEIAEDGDGAFFKFYDKDTLVGRASVKKRTSSLGDIFPENWYTDANVSEPFRDTKPFCYVYELVVNDMCNKVQYEQRSSGKKYGTMCMQKILEWAENNGCSTRLVLEPSNHGSSVHPGKFYAKIGFDVDVRARKNYDKINERRIERGLPPKSNVDGRYISIGEGVYLRDPEVLKHYPL